MNHSNQNSRWRTISIAIFLTGFVAAIYGFGIYLFSALLPDMKASLGFSYTDAGMITGLAQIAFLAFAVFGGALSAHAGEEKTLFGSVILCGLLLLSITYLKSVVLIGIALVLLGGLAASGYVPIVGILGRFVDYQHRGKVMGLISSGTSYGVFINGLLVPVFVLHGHWRNTWLTVGLLTLTWVGGALILFRHLGMFDDKKQEHSHYSGNEKTNVNHPQHGVMSWALVLVCTLTFLNGFTVMPFQNYLAPFLRGELNYSVISASQIWSIIGFSGMIAGFLIGALADKIGTRLTLMLTYALLLSASLLVVWHPNLPVMWLAGVLFAFAFYPIFGLVPSYISKRFSAGKATTIFAVANVTLGVGGMAGNTLGGWVKTQSGTFLWVYLGVAGAALLACLVTVALAPEEKSVTTKLGIETT